MTEKTLSCSTRRFMAVASMAGSNWVSMTIIWYLRPCTPPRALMSSRDARTASTSFSPRKPAAPEIGARTPTRICVSDTPCELGPSAFTDPACSPPGWPGVAGWPGSGAALEPPARGDAAPPDWLEPDTDAAPAALVPAAALALGAAVPAAALALGAAAGRAAHRGGHRRAAAGLGPRRGR